MVVLLHFIVNLSDEALLFHEKTLTDAQFYKIQKAAETNQVFYFQLSFTFKLLLTREYLQLEMIKSIANTTKIYFGPSLHSMFVDFLDLLVSKQISGEGISRKIQETTK